MSGPILLEVSLVGNIRSRAVVADASCNDFGEVVTPGNVSPLE
jgi:hypothetical protein